MGENVELRGPPANPEADHEFIADCCRYQEGIATEQAIKAKYRFATIRARDICRFGPNSIRDRESAIKMAEILVRHGWLVPMKTHRHDAKRWRIALGPD